MLPALLRWSSDKLSSSPPTCPMISHVGAGNCAIVRRSWRELPENVCLKCVLLLFPGWTTALPEGQCWVGGRALACSGYKIPFLQSLGDVGRVSALPLNRS